MCWVLRTVWLYNQQRTRAQLTLTVTASHKASLLRMSSRFAAVNRQISIVLIFQYSAESTCSPGVTAVCEDTL